ncbi:AI-2E family transporter [Uniformispora flossi]|uniref:AI-2E family transporter n=2 Tax=Uniformispora flossi TaxID=3390723 RepID=UPI003C2ABE65
MSRPADGLPPGARRLAAWCVVGLLVAAVFVVAALLVVYLRAVTAPLAVAVLGSALLYPLHQRLVRWRLPHSAAAALTCLVLVVLIVGVGWILVRLIADSAPKIGRQLSEAADRLREQYGSAADPASQAADGMRAFGGKLASALASGVVGGVGIAIQLATGGILTLALTFFLLRDAHKLPAFTRAVVPGRYTDLTVKILRRAFLAVAGFMRGTTLIALIDALFIALGLALLGVPRAEGLAALVFVGAYVPYVGAFLSGLVAVLVAFADQGLGTALWALAVVLAVQQIEGNFLQPGIQSRTVSLHPAVVMVSVVAGGAVLGVLGAMLAVPTVAMVTSIIALLREERAKPDGPENAGVSVCDT